MRRREFLAAGAVLLQTAGQDQGRGGQKTNFAPMDENAYRPVTRPPKPNATPSMDAAARDTFEHDVLCMCGCTLNVYTCRTTDFSCPISPSMHKDIQAMVAGGYGADEIMDAFVERYGERVRTAPKRSGFNLAGYLMPFVALATGVVIVTMLLRRWTNNAALAPAAATVKPVHASTDELARLEAAVRDDEDDEE